MELDYAAIKALSSPTRIKILHRIMEKDATPTRLSTDLEKSKSTIASHLSVLEDAGLVDKDKEEGRRRVTYGPTRKARAIIEGRERTVRFSVASSVLSTAIGIGILGTQFWPRPMRSQDDVSQATTLMMDSAEAGMDAATTSDTAGLLSPLMSQDALAVVAGMMLFAISFGSLYYAWLLRPHQTQE